MDVLNVTGFDSAWGGTQRGAICDLRIDKHSGAIEIDNSPVSVSWSEAVERVANYAKYAHHIIAIDQGLIVPNQFGMRPVERMLAKALGSMHCSAYPSSRSNEACYGAEAGIWAFLSRLDQNDYIHEPMCIPGSEYGRFYFECYPHPAIIALLDRTKILKYKCRHKNEGEWKQLVAFLKGLPVRNLPAIVEALSSQNKTNEDKLDSIVCAYVAVLWWQEGVKQSSMLGGMESGYVVTPHSDTTLMKFKKVFARQMNDSCGPPPSIPQENGPSTYLVHRSEPVASVPATPEDDQWAGPVDLIATDTSNLSRNMRLQKGSPSQVINEWMKLPMFCGYRLIVKLLDEDAEPEVAFIPHSHSESQMAFMADKCGQPGLWFLLVAGASKKTPLTFRVRYRYQPLH